MTADLFLAIDQGTTSTRAIAYDRSWRVVAIAGRRLATNHPRAGWAEQDPDEILQSVIDAVAEVLDTVGGRGQIEAVGLANQGETVVAWDRATGSALGPAVLWSCKRSQGIVDRVAAAGLGPMIEELTGLPLDPYFSAGKMRWLIENVAAVGRAADDGRLAIGTVDAWLTARLGGTARTDSSTASRTQLFGLGTLGWDDRLLEWWDVRAEVLPVVVPSTGELGTLGHPRWGGDLPLRAMLCDQQAALVAHGGHRPGTIKATYGTGVFVLANAGPAVPPPLPGILRTVAWTDADGRPAYALDGGVFPAGSLLEWLHADLGIVDEPKRIDALAGEAPDSGGVQLLPALAGLGAPWWRPEARVVISGLSGATNRGHVARAAIDAIAQRVADIVEAMTPDLPTDASAIPVDGGLTLSQLLMQRQADLLGRPVAVASEHESTALGVALMAAIGVGRISGVDTAAIAGVSREVAPQIGPEEREAERARWSAFVRGALALPGPSTRGT